MLLTGVILGLAGSPNSQACPGGDDTRFVAINRLVLGKSTPEPGSSPWFLWGFPIDFPNKINPWGDTGLFGCLGLLDKGTTCHRKWAFLTTTLTALRKLEGKVKPMRGNDSYSWKEWAKPMIPIVGRNANWMEWARWSSANNSAGRVES